MPELGFLLAYGIKNKMKCTDEKRIISSFIRNNKVVHRNKYIINTNYQKNKDNDI